MDSRLKKLADIFTDYSIKINKGDRIELRFGVEAKDLALEVYKNILKKGALPVLNPVVPGFAYEFFKLATDEQLTVNPIIAEFEAKNVQGNIMLGAQQNTRELSTIAPEKMTLKRKTTSHISDIIVDRDNWVIFEYPTAALAQDADMSLSEFEDFVFDACLVDWEAEEKRQLKLKKILDEGKEIRIVGENTDLTFSIEGRQSITCCGKRNMPDGEVFIAPVEDTTEGFIHYSFPAIYGGREVHGIKLKFEKGKVVEATADKNEEFLKEMIGMDKGASFLGECGIATNEGITRHVKQILFDEKIAFTVHLALGRAYKEGGGKNESALHWDMIKDLRQGGKIIIDGEIIQEDGKWLIDL